MNFKQFLIIMLIGALICWAMFLLVIFNIDPANGFISLLLFYSSLTMALIGSLSIIGTIIRIFVLKKQIIFKEVKNSLRQSFLFSFFIIIILILQSKSILAWWNALFLVIVFAAFEGLIVSIGRK
ncbi:MAG: hypothetical protein V1891_03850 [bacterium]